MTDDEIATLIVRLHEKTLKGQIPWENMQADDAFRAPFARYSVTISKESGFDSDVGEEYTTYKLSIVDEQGREVDSFGPWGTYMKGKAGESLFRETYEAARRKARGLDEALESLLAELGPASSAKQDDLDDEIPF